MCCSPVILRNGQVGWKRVDVVGSGHDIKLTRTRAANNRTATSLARFH